MMILFTSTIPVPATKRFMKIKEDKMRSILLLGVGIAFLGCRSEEKAPVDTNIAPVADAGADLRSLLISL